jgi:hypothetical protein
MVVPMMLGSLARATRVVDEVAAPGPGRVAQEVAAWAEHRAAVVEMAGQEAKPAVLEAAVSQEWAGRVAGASARPAAVASAPLDLAA